jgi:hypothetical protein
LLYADAVDIITREGGSQFHPHEVDAFLRVPDRLVSSLAETADRTSKK